MVGRNRFMFTSFCAGASVPWWEMPRTEFSINQFLSNHYSELDCNFPFHVDKQPCPLPLLIRQLELFKSVLNTAGSVMFDFFIA